MSSTQYEQSDKGKESTSKSIILGGKNLFLQNFTPRQEDFHSQKLSSTFKIIATQGVYQLLPTRKENMFTPKKLSFPETFFHNLVFKEHTNNLGFKEHTSREVEPVSRKLSFPLQLFCSSHSPPQNYLSSAQPLEEDPDGIFL